LHEIPVGSPFQWLASIGKKEIWRFVISCPQVGSDTSRILGLDWIGSGDRALDPVNVDPSLPVLKVVTEQKRDLGSSKAVMIGQMKDGFVSFARDHRKELAQFFLSQKEDGTGDFAHGDLLIRHYSCSVGY
jgi:hypothetical protein